MPASLLEVARALVAADLRQSPEAVLRGLGVDAAQAAALFARPDALRAVLTEAVQSVIVPALPAVIKRIAQRAASGTDPDAEKLVLSLMGDKSPLKEHAGLGDLKAGSDASLVDVARQLRSQLDDVVRGDAT